ncbi:MAG: rod shape-determining protein MreC [Candidatus Krumholzibacteria bacterium]|nr:rod shape-determining protein MreC [Candidatus Krumholzibacteria bacterium]
MPVLDLLFRKHREKTTLALLILLSLTLLALPKPAKIRFAQSTVNVVFSPAQRFVNYLQGLGGLRKENARLRRMVTSLMLERERLTQFRVERERLRRMAAFKEEQFLKLVPCEVIGRNLDRFQTILIVDKGSADSLRARMPVLSHQGYVGRVANVFEHSAWVQLISSRNSPVSCIDKRSRVVGVLEWRDHSYFELNNVSVVEDVQVGDTLITSGFGGVAPKGFPVAVVTKVIPDIDGLSLRVDAKSHIEFRSLEEVFVVTEEIPWQRAIMYDEQDSTVLRNTMGVQL